jgi:hypothetical protein
MSVQLDPGLIDDLIEVYVDWREECAALTRAYDEWAAVAVADRDLAFAAYQAAVDREQQASAVYSDYLDKVQREIGRSNPPEPPALHVNLRGAQR